MLPFRCCPYLRCTRFAIVLTSDCKTKSLRSLILVLALVAWCRLLAAVVVRTSIETSIRRISREGCNADTDHNQILMIAFSWGGADLAEMIARGMIGGDNQFSALLIAATIHCWWRLWRSRKMRRRGLLNLHCYRTLRRLVSSLQKTSPFWSKPRQLE